MTSNNGSKPAWFHEILTPNVVKRLAAQDQTILCGTTPLTQYAIDGFMEAVDKLAVHVKITNPDRDDDACYASAVRFLIHEQYVRHELWPALRSEYMTLKGTKAI
jgi:hypothetical protein